MKRFKTIPFFLFLLPLFFCLHGTVENYGYLQPFEVLWIGVVILACMAVLFLIIWAFSKNHIFSALISFFISVWYLFFGALHDWIKSIPLLSFAKSYTVLLLILLLFTCLWILFLKKKKALLYKLVLYLNVLTLLYCCIDSFLVLKNYLANTKKTTVDAVYFDRSGVVQKPDVYYIVLDEYPGFKSLQDSFAFSNNAFKDYLFQRSFKVLPVFSNYDLTYFSMSSILNMNYVKSDFKNLELTQRDLQKRGVEIKKASVFSIFQSMGYQMENLSIFDIADKRPVSSENSFLLAHAVLLTDKILHNRMKRDIGDKLGKIIPFWKNRNFYYHDVDNKYTEKMLLKKVRVKTEKPAFVYAHFMMPHGPYYYDSLGNKNPYPKISSYTLWNDKRLFVSYIKYVNKRMENMLDNIISKNPDAVIIVMGDHGYREYADKRIYQPYRYDNLCAVRFPDNNHISFKESWSNVNLFRYLFNCQFNQHMPYLSDSTVVLHY